MAPHHCPRCRLVTDGPGTCPEHRRTLLVEGSPPPRPPEGQEGSWSAAVVMGLALLITAPAGWFLAQELEDVEIAGMVWLALGLSLGGLLLRTRFRRR